MKNKKTFIATLALICALATATACGGGSGEQNPTSSQERPSSSESVRISSEDNSSEDIFSEVVSSEESIDESSFESSEDSSTQGEVGGEVQTLSFGGAETVDEYRTVALNTVKNYYTTAKRTLSLSDKQKETLDVAYNAIALGIRFTNGTGEEVKNKLNTLFANIQTFTNTLQAAKEGFEEQKAQALQELETLYSSLSSTLTNDTAALKSAYDKAKGIIDGLKDGDSVKDALTDAVWEFVGVGKSKVTAYVNDMIADKKAAVKQTLDTLVEGALSHMDDPYASELRNFYNDEIAKFDEIEDWTELDDVAKEVADDTKAFVTEKLSVVLAAIKAEAKEKLDEAVGKLLDMLPDGELKTELNGFYNTEIGKINAIDSLDNAKTVASEVLADTEAEVKRLGGQALTAIKAEAKEKLDTAVGKLLDMLPDGELKTELNGFYNTEIGKINAIDSLDNAKTVAGEVLADTEAEVKKIGGQALTAIKAEAKEKLDEAVGKLLDMLPDGELKTELNGFYNTEIGKINAIDSLDNAKTVASEVLTDTEAEVKKIGGQALTAIKAEAKAKLDTIVGNGLNKIKNQTIRGDIDTYYQTEIGKIDAIDSLDSAKTVASEVLSDTKAFILGKLKDVLGEIKGLAVVQQLIVTPDVWEYMPSALRPASMAYAKLPASDFSSFVNVSDIGTKFVGKNLKTVFDVFGYTEDLIKATSAIGKVTETVAAAYQTFIDDGEGDITEFVGEAAGFKVKISINEDKNEILIGNSTVNAEYSYDKANKTTTARIQVTGGIAGKFEVSENEIHVGLQVSVAEIGTFHELDMVRTNGTVEGNVYSRTGNSKLALNGNTYFVSDKDTLRVTSNKRYAGVLAVTAANETYDVKTGEFIGGEIEETNIAGTDFDTLWYQLRDVSGFTSVQCGAQITVDEETGEEQTESSTTKVNGGSKEFKTIKVNKLNLLSSRRYYVESVCVYYYVTKTEGEKTTYELTKVNVPLLFVQKEQTATFGDDVKDNNGSEFASEPVLPDLSLVTDGYADGKGEYVAMKDKKIEDITDYIGEKNSFFAK